VNERLEFASELDIDLARTDFGDHSNAKSGMIDAISHREAILHRVLAQRPLGERVSCPLFSRSPRGRGTLGRGGAGRALTEEVVALTGSTLDPFNLAIIVEGGNDVFADVLALSAMGVDIASELWLLVDSED
jgi:hypothetical protein